MGELFALVRSRNSWSFFPKIGRVLFVIDVGGMVLDTSTHTDKFGLGTARNWMHGLPSRIDPTLFAFVEVALWDPQGGKAHKDFGKVFPDGTRYEYFKFTDESLAPYRSIFLFGYRPGEPGSGLAQDFKLPPDELAAIHRFMDDKQGGVFATGDHGSLGRDLCGDIRRVRAMRHWQLEVGNEEQTLNEQTGLDHYFTSPPLAGPMRFDTVQPTTAQQRKGTTGIPSPPGTFVEWLDYLSRIIPDVAQQDSDPKPVHPEVTGQHPSARVHPIAYRSRSRLIVNFPDHPHEGRVRDRNFALFAAQQTADWEDDFPDVAGFTGPGQRPTTIFRAATAATSGGNTLLHQKGEVITRDYSLASVYDGLRNTELVGRIVVDSTWHNWLSYNVNELADKGEIASYFRNVAGWLAGTDPFLLAMLHITKLGLTYPGRPFSVDDGEIGLGLEAAAALESDSCAPGVEAVVDSFAQKRFGRDNYEKWQRFQRTLADERKELEVLAENSVGKDVGEVIRDAIDTQQRNAQQRDVNGWLIEAARLAVLAGMAEVASMQPADDMPHRLLRRSELGNEALSDTTNQIPGMLPDLETALEVDEGLELWELEVDEEVRLQIGKSAADRLRVLGERFTELTEPEPFTWLVSALSS